MRKSSKLLAVLLTLCLLFGAITAIFASADGEATNTLKITDYSFNYEDFGDTKTFESENSGRAFGIKSALGKADNNSYVRIFCDTADMSSTSSDAPKYRAMQGRIMYTLGFENYKDTIPEGATHSDRDLKNFDYLTIDFDLGSDRYAYSYTKDGATAYVTAKDDAEFKTLTGLDFDANTMTKGLAFLDNNNFGFSFNIHSSITDDAISYNNPDSGSTSKYWNHNLTTLFKIFKSGNDWYVGVKGDLSSAAKLKGEVGAFDHIQVIFKINQTETELTMTPYLFVNGEFAATLTAWSSTGKYNMLAWMLFDTNGRGATGSITEKNYDKYSVAFDNFAVNYYNETKDPEAASIKSAVAKLSSRYSDTHDFSEESESVTTKNDKGELEYSTKTTGKSGIGLANTAMSRYMLVTHKTLNGNTYARVHYNSEALSNPTGVDGTSDQKNRGGVIGLRAPTTVYSAKVELSNYQYMTFDFDFCADQYRYKYNDVWYTEENLPAEAIAVKDTLTKELAMGDSSSMGFHPFLNAAASLGNLSEGSTNKAELSDLEARFTAISGVWYAYLGDESNKVALSNEAGVFDHFTYALEYLGGDSFKATFYVNGQYAGDKTNSRVAFTSGHASPTLVGKQMAFFMMYFTTHTNSNKTSDICNKMYDKYSLAFDNMAVNYYSKDALPYTSLDETLADKTILLYNPDAEDVVYNENYVTPNTDRYAVIGGKTYYVIGAALNKLSEGETVYLYNAKFESFAKELNSFTVICDEGSSFDFAADFPAWRYAKVGDTYKRVINGQVYANVTLDAVFSMKFNFYIPYVEGLEFVKTYTSAEGTGADSAIHNAYGKTTINGETYLIITWNGRMDYVNRDKAGYVEFTYTDGEGATPVTLEARFEAVFNFITYATKVAEQKDCHSEEVQLIRAMIEYREALNPILKANSTDSIVDAGNLTAFYAACNAHKGCTEEGECTCTNVAAKDYINVGTAHDSEHKEDVYFGVSGRNVHIYVKAAVGQSVSINYTNIKGTSKTVEAEKLISGDAVFPNIDITDIDNDLTITVYNVTGEGENAAKEIAYSFEYSLADFSTTEEYAPLLAALKKLAIAAENYKVYIKNPTPAN